ncbi:hypothetical protein POM88_033307 [Heracleum sosnowskyi]|uniref:Uncharacterized protein n=1 Tax=Heracleum sosnowskyi TaxID=360622 RepID=A0AAD8I278_9APIA|nr:hypothetical protein POM88_033307 [Heracleum sosnowskyi]
MLGCVLLTDCLERWIARLSLFSRMETTASFSVLNSLGTNVFFLSEEISLHTLCKDACPDMVDRDACPDACNCNVSHHVCLYCIIALRTDFNMFDRAASLLVAFRAKVEKEYQLPYKGTS